MPPKGPKKPDTPERRRDLPIPGAGWFPGIGDYRPDDTDTQKKKHAKPPVETPPANPSTRDEEDIPKIQSSEIDAAFAERHAEKEIKKEKLNALLKKAKEQMDETKRLFKEIENHCKENPAPELNEMVNEFFAKYNALNSQLPEEQGEPSLSIHPRLSGGSPDDKTHSFKKHLWKDRYRQTRDEDYYEELNKDTDAWENLDEMEKNWEDGWPYEEETSDTEEELLPVSGKEKENLHELRQPPSPNSPDQQPSEGRPVMVIGEIEARPWVRLPEEAPALWKVDRIKGDESETPIDFIRRVYGEWIGHGLTRSHLLHLDKPLYMALAQYLRNHEMPPDINLPTRSEVLAAEGAKPIPKEVTEAQRLVSRWQRRRARSLKSD